MERKYFGIDERLAFNARRQWSFTDYISGTITNEYKRMVDEVYNTVEEIETNQPQYFEDTYKIALRYSQKLSEWFNKKHSIDMMCPSVMICGAGNFPTRKKERQNERMDAHWKEWEYITALPNKIDKILKGNTIIKSNDENAIEKLQQKVKILENLKAGMIEGNKYYKKNGTLEGFGGMEQEKVNQTMDLINRGIFGSSTRIFDTTNTNASIKRTKQRIEKLIQERKKGIQETVIQSENENAIFRVVENTELMRLQVFFNDKPEEEVRTIIKRMGLNGVLKMGHGKDN